MFNNWHWQAGIWLSYPCINMTAVPWRLKCSAAFHTQKPVSFIESSFGNYLVTSWSKKLFHLRLLPHRRISEHLHQSCIFRVFLCKRRARWSKNQNARSYVEHFKSQNICCAHFTAKQRDTGVGRNLPCQHLVCARSLPSTATTHSQYGVSSLNAVLILLEWGNTTWSGSVCLFRPLWMDLVMVLLCC